MTYDELETLALSADADSIKQLLALLRRDWAVRVLDAWVDSNEGFWSNGSAKGKPCCMLHYASGGKTPYQSMTSDAARHAAAEAVFPTLPDAARAELGECP